MENFVKTVLAYQSGLDWIENANNIGIDLIETPIMNAVDTVFDSYLQGILNDDGIDLVYWWLFEDVDKIIYKDEEIIAELHTVEDLYNYIKNNKELWKEPLQK